MQQLELKVELSKSELKRLGGELRCEDLASGLPPGTRQRTVYFDTPEHNLHATGLSMRLRRQDGHWLQMIKADRHAAEGTQVLELQSPVAMREPDLAKIANRKVRRAVQNAVRGTSLNPVFEAVVRRTSRKIKAKSSKAALAVDGGVQPGEGTTDVGDAELELKAGSADGLLLAVEKLLGAHEIKLGRQSKLEHAYRRSKQSESRAKPGKARPVRIARKYSCREAFSAILASAIEQIAVSRQAVLHTDDPEGAHQLRIGLRRLRSALRALRPLVDGGSLRAFERSAREMGRCVGMVRDADVLISGIEAPIARIASDKSGFAELRDALVSHQHAKREEVRSALGGSQWAKLHLYLMLWPRTLEERDELAKPVTEHARRILHKAWRKVAKLGRRLDRLDAEQRHEMRKALKELRYQAEFFAPLFKKHATRKFIEQLKALQDVFGYVNDARMAPRLLEVHHERQVGVNAARAASYTVGRHEAEAVHVWRVVGTLWKELRGSPRFWT